MCVQQTKCHSKTACLTDKWLVINMGGGGGEIWNILHPKNFFRLYVYFFFNSYLYTIAQWS